MTRESPAVGPLRIVRSGLLVVVAFGLASLAHVAAGGKLPPAVLLLPTLVPVAGAAYLLTGRLVRTRTTALLMVGLQLLLHQFLSTVGGYVRTGSVPEPVSPGLTGGLLTHLSPLSPEPSALAPHPGFTSVAALAMLAVHLLATALAVGALAAFERALWRVWLWLRPIVVLLRVLVQFPQHRRVSVLEIAGGGPVLLRVGRRRKRRGPPWSTWTLVPA